MEISIVWKSQIKDLIEFVDFEIISNLNVVVEN